MQPKVSVVIPAYNAAETIERTLRSIHAQTIAPFEIVIGDDASTDNTVALARKMGATVLELPKANGAAARNAAFEATTGDYIFLIDADDEWLPNKIETHLRVHEETTVGFVIDPSRRVRSNGEERGLNGEGPAGLLTWEDMIEHRNWSSGSAISVTRENWLKVGGFNPKLKGLQDVDFLVRVSRVCGPGFRIPESLTRYHLMDGGLSRGSNWQEQIVQDFAESCDFASPAHILSIRRTVALRNAINSGPIEFWKHIRWGHLQLTDPRVLRGFALVVAKKLRLT
jgi:glycosyltransferase involved in cell wall biosynthesis